MNPDNPINPSNPMNYHLTLGTGGIMKDILDQMEEHIAAIRNLQRNFDFHSKILEKLMISLTNWHLETQQGNDTDEILYSDKKE